MKKLNFDQYLLIALALIVALSLYFSWRSPLATAVRKGEIINGLVMGTDLVDNCRHSDTLLFLNYNPKPRFLNVVSIPRDTHFSPKGFTFRKINEVYAYHWRTTKDERLAGTQVRYAVEELFQNRVSIPYYVQIDYDSFRKFINLIGGITVDIDEPMHYDDNAGNLHIHFDTGTWHLDGQKALEYVRYRNKAGDLGRVYRQQQFIKAVLSRFKNPAILLRIPRMLSLIGRDIKTNLTFWDMTVALLEIRDLKARDIRLAQLPGSPNRDMWEVDQENCATLFDRIAPSTATASVSAGPRIKVSVWNASGKTKLAEKVTWILRKQGFDVLEWGTYSVVQKKTIVKDLSGNLRAAQKLADVIACGEVITRVDTKQFVDISVILGEDCVVDAK